ncbi:atypical chemokine receptor 1 [Cricetulus griseus]|uniref:Atypical chemokine receptor 1 n=1 Tax=Cricetulus griseus TaxID=10029 RepID=G3H809_CRIGR|nr:atypical chemokine receptor 1 [Cricetulus griseus]XP_027274734.1 atypical chemokine receptor 1 [Cricetulus griseus]EGV93425.1 Duffy antigen/chemokine receptor [Cricetulus griseus]
MGNCLHPVETSFSLDENGSQFSSEFWIYSYEDNATYEVMDNFSIGAAAPCYSCNLLDSSSLPFFILTSVLGVLASGTVLFAILKPLSHWQICPSWPILAQLAVGSGLFSFAVPVLAPGLNTAHSTGLCFLGYWIWYTSAFAQALLIGCYACLTPRLGIGQIRSHTLGLTVGLWGAALLLGLPVTLASDVYNGLCTLASNKHLEALKFTHSAICFTIFTVLPLALLAAKGVKKALSKGPGPWVSVLWIWFIFWWPHGMVLLYDAFVRSKTVHLQSCQSQKILDVMLNLAEALAVLHCVATPLLLALFCYQTTRRSLPSLSLPARQSCHTDAFAVKS